jgi:hypothetical protein
LIVQLLEVLAVISLFLVAGEEFTGVGAGNIRTVYHTLKLDEDIFQCGIFEVLLVFLVGEHADVAF